MPRRKFIRKGNEKLPAIFFHPLIRDISSSDMDEKFKLNDTTEE
jgi:hypothetical protein